ncbi:hypothetical protein OAL66_01735 [bacterium]|nr:hypothetical protein [bacterium]
MAGRPNKIKVAVTTSFTHLMIFISSSLAVHYLYEFFFTDIREIQNPLRYLTKYVFCGFIFLYCMKESTLIEGKKATFKTCYPPHHVGQYLAHGLGLLRGLISVMHLIQSA